MSIALVTFACIFLITAILAGFMIVLMRSRADSAGPRCGNCSYDLTGSTSNRCPECGKLFIEAGVVVALGSASARRRRVLLIGTAAAIGAILLALVGVATLATRAAYEARQAAVAQAMVARQQAEAAAVAQFQAQMLADLDKSSLGRTLRSSA